MIKLFEEYSSPLWDEVTSIISTLKRFKDIGVVNVNQSTFNLLKNAIKSRCRVSSTTISKFLPNDGDVIAYELLGEDEFEILQIKGSEFCSYGSSIEFNDHQDKIKKIDIFEFKDEWFFVRVSYLHEQFLSYFVADQKLGLIDLLEVLGVLKSYNG